MNKVAYYFSICNFVLYWTFSKKVPKKALDFFKKSPQKGAFGAKDLKAVRI
jgi:hypothetical protein